ncbi:MAG: riboflavin synthase [Campylobacterales bacterium]
MFTGLIREIGEVVSLQGERLEVACAHRAQIGDSIAVNGACLTVVKTTPHGFVAELSHESQKVLAIENYRGKVHIEPAMRLSDRLEGHIVQGHIDGIGVLESVVRKEVGSDMIISAPKEILSLIVPKGSIAVDGVSLTVNEVLEGAFRLTIIPHTLHGTLLGSYKPGRRVNLETDILVRTIARLMQTKREQGVGWEMVDRIMALYS